MQAPHPLMIRNPANNTICQLERVPPTTGRRTLGVILAPDGSGSSQLKLCLFKARDT